MRTFLSKYWVRLTEASAALQSRTTSTGHRVTSVALTYFPRLATIEKVAATSTKSPFRMAKGGVETKPPAGEGMAILTRWSITHSFWNFVAFPPGSSRAERFTALTGSRGRTYST